MKSRSIAHLTDQYLARHAEPEITFARHVPIRYRHILIVPAANEPADCAERLLPERIALPLNERVLVILVVNAPQKNRNAWIECNAALLRRTTRSLQELPRLDATGIRARAWHGALSPSRGVDLLVIDRAVDGSPLPDRQGVGLARKIGADLGLALHRSANRPEAWLHMTDADARIDAHHFDADPADAAALVYPFDHTHRDAGLQRRAHLYDLHLRHYVSECARAGSRYAYHTLGSVTAVRAAHYAAVRGVPRRNGAEDFHLLNKLAKTGPVVTLAGPKVVLSGRRSARAPFGTGAALIELEQIEPETYASYAPGAFAELRNVFDWVRLQTPERAACPDALAPDIAATLQAIGMFDFVNRAREQYRTHASLQRAMFCWFDALKIVRFVNRASARHPKQPLLNTLQARFGARSLEEYRRRLDAAMVPFRRMGWSDDPVDHNRSTGSSTGRRTGEKL